MIKFIIQSKKEITSIVEVECELVSAVDDPSVMWLPQGEFKFKILKPITFHQKSERNVDGKREVTMVPDVWCSHSFYESLDAAKLQASSLIRYGFEFSLRKYGASFVDEDVAVAISKINIITL